MQLNLNQQIINLIESISAFEVSKDKSKLGKMDEKFYRNEVIGKIEKKTQDKIEHLIKKLKWVPEEKEMQKKKRHQRFLQDQKHHHHHDEEQDSGDTALQHSKE